MTTAEISPGTGTGTGTATRLRGPLTSALALGAIGAVVSTTVGLLSGVVLGLPSVAVVGATVIAAVGFTTAATLMHRHHHHGRLGAANVVTSLRLGMVAVLAGLLLAGDPLPVLAIAVAIVALSLDGVDGYLARRQRLSSRFGAGFDMEVDSLFALVLAALAALGPAGPLALALGLPRYLFGAAAVPLPWLNGDLPERYSRKVVCVVQLIALIALQLPFMPEAVAIAITVGALAALGWSFGLDVAHLRRARA